MFWAETEKYDLVISDVPMPGMSDGVLAYKML